MAERALAFPQTPFPYQCEGVAFLYPRHAAILADEMGLGKTMQAITTIRLLLHRGEIRRVLIACPKPLVNNWRRELAHWAPEVPTAVIEGTQTRRRWQWQLTDVPVKIANYELLHRDADAVGEDRGAWDFDLVVLDESQRIKNRHGATSQAVRAIRGGRRWALTGTPVENSAEDLVGIFEFLAPGFLSPEMRPRRMGRAVSDYVLRRTKEQVLRDLPPKLFRDAELALAPEQADAYRLAETDGVVHLKELGGAATIQHVFELILRLKQICNFDPATGASAKLERLEADLEEVAQSGRKALVFSQWVETLVELRRRLAHLAPLEYHGRVAPGEREGVLRRFRDDPDAHVLLISYGVGSVGLNLQFASYVFLFDRWWNPAVEDQAINRVHRIGSAEPVTVTRFLMLDTIEERIHRILEEKRELFDVIFSGAAAGRRLGLSQEEIFGLFDIAGPAARAAA
ncbi:MAG: DEAD/DEAH box helicase [Pirellulales bacterium]|nr:DEAD/DEAH box helicase [Pirellulales bacterium]